MEYFMESTSLAPKPPVQFKNLPLLQNSYNEYETTNIKLLNNFKKFNPNGHNLICSYRSVGLEFENELLIVGKNPYCWWEDFSIKELYDNGGEYIFHNKVLCNNKEIESSYPPFYYHNYDNDPFWDCIDDVVPELCRLELKADWPGHVALTYLYKIAYSNKRSLSEKTRLTQLELCKKLFQIELSILKPKRILFLIGMKCAHEFLDFHESSSSDNIVCSIKDYEFGTHNAHVVVTVHPKKCRRENLARDIINAFES